MSSRSRSRSRSRSYSRSRSRSRDRSVRVRDHRYSGGGGGRRYDNGGGGSRYARRSPPPFRGGGSSRRFDSRDNPEPSRCLGVFGLSLHTDDYELRRKFEKFGEVEQVQIVTDKATGHSRGFGFIYFASIDDAIEAKQELSGADIDGKPIRIDYSVTKRAHSPTPGMYMGDRNNRRRTPPRRRYRSASRSVSRSRSRDRDRRSRSRSSSRSR